MHAVFPIFPLILTIFCTLLGLGLLAGGLNETPKPDLPTIGFGAAFSCFAVAAGLDAYQSWLIFSHFADASTTDYSGAIQGFGIVSIILFVIAFLMKLFPGGRLDTDWLQYTLQMIWDSMFRSSRRW